MILSSVDAHAITQKVLSYSKADSCIVTISGSEGRHIRFAQNMATTNGSPSSLDIGVESHFGKRAGSATGTDFSDEALAALVAAAENTAKLAPENPEFMPPLGEQKYVTGTGYADATAKATSDQLASAIGPVLKSADTASLQASGFLSLTTGFSTFATSPGLFVYDQQTSVLNTVTGRTPDGTGAGWAGTTHYDFSKMDVGHMGEIAFEKSVRSRQPETLAPGKYTVILEPSCVSDLLTMMMDYFGQRDADEGRSLATKKGGGSRVGDLMFGKNISLYSDPNDALVPGAIYSDDGAPAARTMWIENGVLKNLQCSRYWAKKSKLAPVVSPTTLTLAGGTTSTADMIKQTKRGLLITRFWYIREVDPQTVVLTGLTRDGVFLIEHGEITKPVCNFRFNESPVAMLNKVIAMGPAVRAYGDESSGMPTAVPTLLVEDFTLSSVSDAV